MTPLEKLQQAKSGVTYKPHSPSIPDPDLFTATINLPNHMDAIEVYAETEEEATALRDIILDLITRGTNKLSVKKYYMTSKCLAEHLLISSKDYVNLDAPWYEIHLYGDNTYNSFQKGHQWAFRKLISKLGLTELDHLLTTGQFSENKADATLISLAAIRKLANPTITSHISSPHLKSWDIWIEGFSATGGSAPAQQVAYDIKAGTFKDACIQFSKTEKGKGFGELHLATLSFWGCRLYNNESDARRSFG